MKRIFLVTTICLLATVAIPALAGARPLDSHCSPSGDYCIAVERTNGRIFMSLRTFSFEGRYKLCIKAPALRRECGWWSLNRRPHGVFASRVSIDGHYPTNGPGRYTVSWFYGGVQLGRGLHFGRE